MSQEKRVTPPAEDERRSLRDDPGPLLTGGLALVVAGCLASAAVRVSGGFWQVALAWLSVLVFGYAAFTLGSVVVFLGFAHVLDGLGRPRPERFRDHWPTWVRVFIPVLVGAWIVGAALYGYDASQWLWTGVSVFAAVVAMLVLTPRRRRPAVPDGPGGPRHREAAP